MTSVGGRHAFHDHLVANFGSDEYSHRRSRSGYRKRLHYASWEVSKRVGRGEIAHVLFLDIVGYSKRLTDEQSKRFRS